MARKKKFDHADVQQLRGALSGKPARRALPSSLGGQAQDLQIGGRLFGHKIKELHELCPQRRTPHVHVLASDLGHVCLEFRQFV